MATLFDPIIVLRTLLAEPALASTVTPHLRRPALKALEVVLKSPVFDVATLASFCESLGEDATDLALDAAPDGVLRATVKRLDPHHPDVAGSATKIDVPWARRHLLALATGEAKPIAKPKPLDKLLPTQQRTQENLAALAGKMGPALFVESIAAMSVAAPRTLVKKLDPQHPMSKGKVGDIDSDWARGHLAELAGIALPKSEGSPENGAEWFAKLQKMYSAESRRRK